MDKVADLSGKSVSLVLGSGAARGLAHIGVIDSLSSHNLEIRSISGTSMGALVGGIYAAGKLDTYRHWVCGLSRADVFRLLDLSFDTGGLFKGDRIIRLLSRLIGDRHIESLPIPFTAVATDIELGREVWLRRGSLFDALRASMAIPAVFTPHIYHGRVLIDGGVVNPLPIAPTLHDKTDLTVAVTLSGSEEATVPDDNHAIEDIIA